MKSSLKSVLLALTLGVWSSSALAVKVGDVLPKIDVKDVSGKPTQPWAGQKTLINFWATWCEACKVELREMDAELAKLKPNQKVIFVSLDKDPNKAKDYLSKEFKSSPAMVERLHSDEAFKLADALGLESFPMTLIVDSSGKVIKVQEGFKEGSGSTAALFDALRQNP
jgi:thiol-disulfide isomerase/thioredoxin